MDHIKKSHYYGEVILKNLKKMEKKVLILLLCCMAFSYNVLAVEKFTFTWIGSVEKFLMMDVTPEEDFTVDWGDGNIEPWTGDWDFVFLFYDYPDEEEYTVTITGLSEECKFYLIGFDLGQLVSIDVTECPSLINLGVSDGFLTELDVSANHALEILDCNNNPLGSIDVSNNPVLERLFVDNIMLTEIDLSANPKLDYLSVRSNQISSLDLSANPNITSLYCNNNNLSRLDLSLLSPLLVDCYENHIPLSDLFFISETIPDSENKRLGPQTLLPVNVNINEEVNFSNQAVLGETATVFEIPNAIANVDYSIENGIIKFMKAGKYTVKMTNDAVVSSTDYPAKVTVEINVANSGIRNENMSEIFVYPNPTEGIVNVKSEKGMAQELKLFAIDGRLLQTVYATKIDMTDYASGFYFLQVAGKNMKIVKK